VHAACANGRQITQPSPLSRSEQPVGQLVIGYVDDTAFQPLSNVTVEVVDGPQAGLSTTTDGSGKFSLNGQFSSTTRFRATRNGYQAATEPLLTSPVLFFLAMGGPSGNHAVLTVDADPDCIDLPPDVRSRSYPAEITSAQSMLPANTAFLARLSGSSLDSYFHNVFIRTENDVVTFDLSDNGIEDEVAEEAYYYVGGVVHANPLPGATTISAPLDGLIDYCEVSADPGSRYPCTNEAIARVQCRSSKNRMTLTWQ
jgi:hypothetical protein